MASMASLTSYLFLLSLLFLAANAAPSYGSLTDACMLTPFPDLCMRELGPRLKQSQGIMPAAMPGQVDIRGLVEVANQAATEAGAVASAAFQGKLPGFNTTGPALAQCLSNCTGPIQDAMKQLYGSASALRGGAYDVATNAVSAAINDVTMCSYSCTELSADMRVILDQSMAEFEKLLRIAVAFMSKLVGMP